MNKRERICMEIGLGAIGAFIGVALFCLAVLLFSSACAEESSCWVICQDQDGRPGEVIIRERPTRKSAEAGAAVAGTRLRTDWQESGNWIHLVDLNNETGEGWICKDYIVFDEPVRLELEGAIRGTGRVACRKSIDGELKRWAKPGQVLTVYWISSEWAVTDLGYIRSEYVGVY